MAGDSAEVAAQAPAPRPPVRTSNQWAVLAEADDAEQEGGDSLEVDLEGDGDHADGDDDGEAEDGRAGQTEAAEGPTPSALRQEWERLRAFCRRLEREDEDPPPAVIAAAREQRDEAEKKWRAVKPQQPLHRRLRWAEAELRDAENKEALHRRELESHLASAASRTKELEERLAVDTARTARKRNALLALQGREAVARCPATEAAARIALQGISDSIAPTIATAMASLGEGSAGARHELQLAAQAISRVQEVLREATAAAAEGRQPAGALGVALGTAHYDISGDAAEGPGGGGGDGGSGSDDPMRPAGGTVQRWTRAAPNGQWKKARTSDEAVEEARRMLQSRGPTGGLSVAESGSATAEQGDGGMGADAAYTNDLGEAARRAEAAAQRQFREALAIQQQPKTPQLEQEEEEQRNQRAQQQQLELQRHQAAVEQAAMARAVEEARQREELVARMSPADLARAAEVHAQQQAVGAHAFGSQPASQVAGLVHRSHVHEVAREATREGDGADEEFLMSLSPEEFAQWDRDRQGADNGAVPW